MKACQELRHKQLLLEEFQRQRQAKSHVRDEEEQTEKALRERLALEEEQKEEVRHKREQFFF